MQRVRITVEDGVAYVNEVPPGVLVEVTDYDVDPCSREHDGTGVPCSRYCVTAADLAARRAPANRAALA
jgi:hypothetical protein